MTRATLLPRHFWLISVPQFPLKVCAKCHTSIHFNSSIYFEVYPVTDHQSETSAIIASPCLKRHEHKPQKVALSNLTQIFKCRSSHVFVYFLHIRYRFINLDCQKKSLSFFFNVHLPWKAPLICHFSSVSLQVEHSPL